LNAAERSGLNALASSRRQNPPDRNIPSSPAVYLLCVVIDCPIFGRTSTTGSAVSVQNSDRRLAPDESSSSTKTSESNFSADASAARPVLDALDKFQSHARTLPRRLYHQRRLRNWPETDPSPTCTDHKFRASARLARMQLCFVSTLSNAMRLASAPQPV
jgi:hypothetical protein